MFEPAVKSMPAIDYVSIVRSVYTDRRAMALGALACFIGAAAGAYKTNSLSLYVIAGAFVLIGVLRFWDMTRFLKANMGPTDVEAAARWELRATYFASAFAFVCGSWVFCSFVFVNDGAAELISMATTIACMVGVVSRNFGLERMLTIQLSIAVVLMTAGLLYKFDIYHPILAGLLLPMLISFRFLAADIRSVLLSAVHARVDASRLAIELDTALDTMHHGLSMLDADGLIAVVNGRAEEVFDSFVPGSWEGRSFAALISAAASRGSIPQRSAEQLMQIVNGHRNGKVILRLANARFNEVTVSSRQGKVVLLFEDITDRVRAEERINFMAHYDALTGLPNRGYFAQQVGADLERRRTEHSVDTAVLMIVDIDDFKHVNDTTGHLVGDRLLVEAADRLKRALGLKSLVARLGGDEFIVYRSGAAAPADVTADSEAILAAFKAPFSILGESISTNVSIGMVTSADPEEDLNGLMTKADLALYKAKANGKAQAQLFHDEMDTAYRYRQRLKTELKACVEAKGLTLVFQPLIDLKTRRVVACEALARWTHPTLGSIPPSLFIPVAEETGLISEITRWALNTAAAECRNWPEHVSISVNVSARDFRNDDVEDMVLGALRSTGLAPERLEIEVTETALIEERDAATKILSALGKRGIGIALDDFGTGYSSLSYLQALPFTKLKVDRSFVMDIASNPRSLKLLSNVAQLGKDINLTVTAEGVETEEQLALIQAHTKVDQIQGYLFGVPLPRREVGELIARMEGAQAPETRIRVLG
ncbi:MAG: EAL domain-containing protein [Devosia nanyangense]|uniref:EAL domain-containing protein n=1 Tax=Devosia nanyangense TaxID=1228055 RepID=A0A933L2P4_9HYPH|nr:EAL domain-containing protein [Devosia nanyangense]